VGLAVVTIMPQPKVFLGDSRKQGSIDADMLPELKLEQIFLTISNGFITQEKSVN